VTSMKLRPYQRRALAEIEAAFSLVRRVLFVLPTGGGKTEVAVAAILRAVRRGERVLFLAHRSELINQAFDRLVAAGLPRALIGVMMADDARANPSAMVQVGSVQTVVRRDLLNAQLVVVDEAHHAIAKTYQKITNAYPEADIIGLTATPYGADGKGLAPAFDLIVEGPKTSELIAAGWLAKPRTLTVPVDLLPDLKPVKKARGDYAPGQLEEAVSKRAIVGAIPEHYRKHANGLPAVLYGAGVEHAKMCRDAFAEAGIVAEHVDASTPANERAAIIERLRSGQTQVVTNCGILTEGWDFPDLACVILARPTLSRGLHRQMVGRVMRPGKHPPVVLDHAGNVHAHGWPEDDENATLEGRESDGGPGNGPRAKHCPGCDSAVPLLARECPECGHEFWSVESGPPEEIRAALVDAQPKQTKCVGWGETEGKCDKTPGRYVFGPSKVLGRQGGPWMCRRCAASRRVSIPEFQATHAEAVRRLSADPEWRAKNAEANRMKAADPEWRAKNAEAARKRCADPEWRAKNAEANRMKASDPEWRAKNAEHMRKMSADPEWRAKNAEAARKRCADPEWRAKNAEVLRKAREAKARKEASKKDDARPTISVKA
jgi:DNA repair protein RadD